MKFSELAPRERHNFVYFLLFFFFYYFIMSAYFPFFPVWLADVNHLTKTETGIVFSSISLFAIIFQPVFGLMSDKLGLRKHLLWTITVLLILFAPFFIFVFSPLLQMNIIAGSLVGGIYLGIVFSSGSGAVEAYIERVSRANRFEYGKVRVAGCVGWALCASITGVLFGIDPNITFWIASGFALVLGLLLWLSRPESSNSAQVIEALGANRQAFSLRTAAELLRMPRFWGFIVYVVGVASVYDVFDQQFANFFKSFFASPQRGTEVFGFVTTGGELLNAVIMFCAPAIVNRIGAKNALLTAGMIMSVRILGSSFASSAVEVVILKMLHMFEIPFLLVGTFKYISSAFNPRLSATLFLIGFNLSKQLSGVVLSAWVGRMYDTVGFHQAYLILGCITLSFTLLSFITLRGGKSLLSAAETQTPA
ncbi:MFS transporter [Klebsiella quasipneumoniae]|uniref:MFS transporter n=1 Tax=Klebsiella quasipneumoniae subsp. quasipneumoniae TaxID=1667327 RepID=A0AAW8XGB6_9ENTR|nr:MFS transporter [Klebsiella quasipneumoniae]ELT0942336.1 oligosaccharide MFS transporter [Klebsiella quasipneumoniae]ELT0945493.1 oligosaccharide MFS transporter [Klebsiella quasipneumoniae]MCJ4449251.1 MFS transporter [Klebsiella quasipneumoniae]MDV0839761.1 MFS transporter [Klebsiella quasipneumoniae subsp. quasipneumoniae]PLG87711.1 MFS transporter [Klebsiella quasipneumoniae]